MRKLFFVVTAFIIGSQLQAQDTTSLDEVVLTPHKFEQKQSQTGKVVTVINKTELEKLAGKTLGQVLNEQAGVVIGGAYGANGSVQTVFTRGASSGRTLIVIDGVPVNDPSMIYNEFDLNLVSIQDVERIEICRGAQSTMYGSDAIAGVISIYTIKRDVHKPFNLKATSAFGNRNTARNNIQVFGRYKNFNYATRFSKYSTDGFSSAHDSTGIKNFDKDGYDGRQISVNLQNQFGQHFIIATNFQHSRYKADVDAGIFSDDRDFTIDNKRLGAGASLFYFSQRVRVGLAYHFDDLERNFLNDSLHAAGSTKFERNEYDAHSRYLELYSNIEIKPWLRLLAGVDHRRGSMSQDYLSISGFGPYSSSFSDTSLRQNSVYASLVFELFTSHLNVELGGRYNDHSKYGNNSTFTFNPSYKFNDHWRVFGSIASGFKAPSIYQVYDAFSGEPNLKPEKSTNYEIGVQQSAKKFSSRLLYFNRQTKDGIDFDYVNFKYFNFLEQFVDGIELEINARLTEKLSINANYTFINGEERTQSRKDFSDHTYDYLLRRPDHSFNANIGYQFCEPFFARLSAKTVSNRYDIGGFMKEDILVDGYFLMSFYAEYNCKKNLKLFTDIQNLTDNKFVDIRGFNTLPFSINAGVTFTW